MNFRTGMRFKSKDCNVDGTIPVVKIGNIKPILIYVDNCGMVLSEIVDGLDRLKLLTGEYSDWNDEVGWEKLGLVLFERHNALPEATS